MAAGDLTTEIRDITTFREFNLYDKINVILTPDSIQFIKIEAGKNLISHISTTVSGETLTIQDKNGCKLLRSGGDIVNVYIATGQLQKIFYYGSGNISSTDTLRATNFTIDCNAAAGSVDLKLVADTTNAIIRTANADISLTGHGKFVYVYCQDEGSVNILPFISNTVYVVSKSLLDMKVNVTDNLTAEIFYKGNVYYKGNPYQIDSTISNTGKLIHLQ